MTTFAVEDLEIEIIVEEITNEIIDIIEENRNLQYETLLESYYSGIDSPKDNELILPPQFIINNDLPSLFELNNIKYSNNIAVLCLYFIECYVYSWKSNPVNQTYDKTKTGAFGPNVSSLNTFFNSPVSFYGNSKPIPNVIYEFVYTCVAGKTTSSYGGFACEYTPLGGNKSLFIILRGTQTGPEWFQDSRGDLVNATYFTDTNIKIHKGFNTLYTSNGDGTNASSQTLRDDLINFLTNNASNYSSIIITGHSLGSSIVYLLAADLFKNYPTLTQNNNINFYVNAGPYTGNQNFVNIIDIKGLINNNITKVYAIINEKDPVPNDKLRIDYERIDSQLFFFSDQGDGTGKSKENPHLPPVYLRNVIKYKNIFDNIGNKKEVFVLQ